MRDDSRLLPTEKLKTEHVQNTCRQFCWVYRHQFRSRTPLQQNRWVSSRRWCELSRRQSATVANSVASVIEVGRWRHDMHKVNIYALGRGGRCGFFLALTVLLVHGQVTIIFVVSVCLSVCLCRVFLGRLWSDFDQTRTHVICLGLMCPLEYRGCATPGGWVTPKNLYF